MMAEKARLFLDLRAEELIMSSPDPSAHKRLRRGVRNFDNALWDRVREDAVLAGNVSTFSQNPTMKYHLLSTGTNSLAEASPFDPVWGIGLRADDPEAVIPAGGEGKFARKSSLFGFATLFAAVRPGWQPKPRLSNSAPRPRLAEFMSFSQRRLTLGLWRACQGPPTEFSTCFSDTPADSSSGVSAVTLGVVPSLALPEYGPCFVDGIIALDDASFSTKIAVHS